MILKEKLNLGPNNVAPRAGNSPSINCAPATLLGGGLSPRISSRTFGIANPTSPILKTPSAQQNTEHSYAFSSHSTDLLYNANQATSMTAPLSGSSQARSQIGSVGELGSKGAKAVGVPANAPVHPAPDLHATLGRLQAL